MSLRETLAHRVSAPQAREFVLFGASTLIYQGGRFVFFLAAAGALAPSDFTRWALVLSILVYAPSLLLGVTNGMSRELPILTGADDDDAAQRTESAAWVATILAAIAAIIVSVMAAAFATSEAGSLVLVGLLAAGSIAYFTTLSVLRSRLRFDAASVQQASFGAAILLLALMLALGGGADLGLVAGYYGLCLALSITVGLVLARPGRRFSPSLVELPRLARIGFPIMLAGLLFSLYVTLDRWIAIALLGDEGAAPYALASLIAAAGLVIPSVISQQVYPRMGIARGKGATAGELRAMAKEQGLLATALVTPIVVAVSLFAWLAIPVILPEYEEAVPSIIVLSLGLLVLSLLAGYGNYLNVVGGQWRYLAAQVVGLGAALTLMVVGGNWHGMLGIAVGMSLGHVVYGLVLRTTAMRTGISPDPTSATSGSSS